MPNYDQIIDFIWFLINKKYYIIHDLQFYIDNKNIINKSEIFYLF